MIDLGYPWLAYDYPVMVRAADRMLASAEKAAPDLIEAGRLTQSDAECNIRILRAIAASWHRIIALERGAAILPRDLSASPREKIDVLISAEAKARAAVETLRPQFWASMPASWKEALLEGWQDRRDVRKAFDPDHFPEVFDFLRAEERHWTAEGLLYNARRWPDAEESAEQARHRRDSRREQQAA